MTVEPQISATRSRSDPTLHIRIVLLIPLPDRRGNVVVTIPAWHAGDLGSIPGPGLLLSYVRCKNMGLNINDCVYMCLSDETRNTDCPFYLVFMSEEANIPQGVNVYHVVDILT